MVIQKYWQNNFAQALASTLELLKVGAVVAVPTDTVYGLICDATNELAVKKLFEIKQRAKEKPVGVFVVGIDMAKELALVGEREEKYLKQYWPGAVTFVLKLKPGIKFSDYINPSGTIGMRQPKDDFLLELLQKLGKPLAQSSANISEQPATTKIQQVIDYFKNAAVKPDLIVDGGDLPSALPSSVIDLTIQSPKILRSGDVKI